MMMALDLMLDTAFEVVIAGTPDSRETKKFVRSLNDRYIPHVVTLLRPTDTDTPAVTAIAPFTRHYGALKGKTNRLRVRRAKLQTPRHNHSGNAGATGSDNLRQMICF